MQKSRHSVRLGLVLIFSWRQSEQLDDLLGSFALRFKIVTRCYVLSVNQQMYICPQKVEAELKNIESVPINLYFFSSLF